MSIYATLNLYFIFQKIVKEAALVTAAVFMMLHRHHDVMRATKADVAETE